MTRTEFPTTRWTDVLDRVLYYVAGHDVDVASVLVTRYGVTVQIGGNDTTGVDTVAAEFDEPAARADIKVPKLYGCDVHLDGIPVRIYTGRPE